MHPATGLSVGAVIRFRTFSCARIGTRWSGSARSVTIRTPRGPVAVRSTLVGQPNVYNLMAAVATATALDVPLEVSVGYGRSWDTAAH